MNALGPLFVLSALPGQYENPEALNAVFRDKPAHPCSWSKAMKKDMVHKGLTQLISNVVRREL